MRWFLPCLFLFCSPVTAMAQDAPEIAANAGNVLEKVKAHTVQLANNMLSLADKATTREARIAGLKAALTQNTDTRRLARYTLGRYVRRARPDQFRDYVELLERFIAIHYADRLSDYRNAWFEVGEATRARDDFSVTGRIAFGDGKAAVPTEFLFVREDDGTFSLFDLRLGETRVITALRNAFAKELKQNRGKLKRLLNLLRRTNKATIALHAAEKAEAEKAANAKTASAPKKPPPAPQESRVFILYHLDTQQIVSDFREQDIIRVFTANGDETTMSGIARALDLTFTRRHYTASPSKTNDASKPDIVITWTRGTKNEEDDAIAMVLEDVATTLTAKNFDVR